MTRLYCSAVLFAATEIKDLPAAFAAILIFIFLTLIAYGGRR